MDNYNKFSNILNIKEKQKILFLLILMIFSASLEVLGIGMVIPIITLILSPDQILTNPNYQIFFDYLGNPSKNQTTIYFMFIFLFIYLIKNLFLGFFLWFKLETTKILKVNLSKRLFENYLRKPYEFFLLKNSAHILRNTTTESESAMNMLFAFVNLVAEILVFVFIVSFIIFIEPKGAITTISTLSIFIYIYYFFIKNKVFQWGKKRQYYQGQNIKNIQQSIGGIKEMKILGCEDQFIKIFENNFFPVMKYTQFNQMLSQSLKL